MPITARVLADSIAPCGARLTTMEWKYPRSIHSEIMTHRITSKNSASSRAIPVEKLIAQVVDEPYIPQYIGKKQSGMQAGDELTGENREAAVASWLRARDNAVTEARVMVACHAPKEIVNRLLEPWMWITIIISSTEWSNLYGLRNHTQAERHFQHLAREAIAAMEASTPNVLPAGHWHLPLIGVDSADVEVLDALAAADQLKYPDDFIKISVGRVARVSYLTHDGKRDVMEDIKLHDKMAVQVPLHASPAEHIAQAMDYPQWWKDETHFATPLRRVYNTCEWPGTIRQWIDIEGKLRSDGMSMGGHTALSAMLRGMQSGNFYGFSQYRKQLKTEHIGGYMP